MDFTGKVCVVTGGANGIGRCIVERFAAAGAGVAFIDTDVAAGNKLAARIGGQQALFMPGDIAEEAVISGFATAVIERFSQVDCLINNACISRRGLVSGCGFADFTYVLKLGAIATLNEHGYNTGRDPEKFIPVIGVDATPAAQEAIGQGKMSATVKQDAWGMAKALTALVLNAARGKEFLDGTPYAWDHSGVAIRIPYSPYVQQ